MKLEFGKDFLCGMDYRRRGKTLPISRRKLDKEKITKGWPCYICIICGLIDKESENDGCGYPKYTRTNGKTHITSEEFKKLCKENNLMREYEITIENAINRRLLGK